MISAIQHIDSAIQSLYKLSHGFSAVDFLIPVKPHQILKAAYHPDHNGALYLFSPDNAPEDLEVGIYLSPAVQKTLKTYAAWKKQQWKAKQFSAFCVASEEVSHFNYFLHHETQGKKVRVLDLEIQGDIDRFLVVFFANCEPQKNNSELFGSLYKKLFVDFELSKDLSSEEKELYLKANHDAKAFISRLKEHLIFGNLNELSKKLIRAKFKKMHP